MGEEELQRFVKSRKDFGTYVSIKSLMKKSWEESKRPPFLIIDGLSYFCSIYKESEHWVYSGGWKHCVKEVKAHVRTLIESMELHSPLRNRNAEASRHTEASNETKLVEMLFYFDCSVDESASYNNAENYRIQLDNIDNTFAELKNGIIPYKHPFKNPFGILDYARYLLKYECKCKVNCFLENTHQEIARLAKENPACFGILSEDCEYLIYDTRPLLFINSLNLVDMTAKTYSNMELARAVKLNPSQLKLLSCALGNAVIYKHLLDGFHQKIAPNFANSSKYTLVHKVANYIRERNWKENSKELWTISHVLGIETDLLSKGLNRYDLQRKEKNNDKPESEVINLIRSKCFECQIPADIYSILCCNKYVEGLLLEDPNDEQLPSSSIMFRPVRQRMYFVLFEGRKERVQEWFAHRKCHMMEPEMVDVSEIPIKGKTLSLTSLWLQKAPLTWRWNLFVMCLGIEISIYELQEMQPRYVILCCILSYLRQFEGIHIENWEIKTFIFQALHPLNNDVIAIHRLQLGTVLPRAVSLCNIFLRGVSNALNILGTCGLPFPLEEAMPWKYFDGKVFHHCYRSLKCRPDSDNIIKSQFSKDSLFRQFKKLYQIIKEEI